MNSLGKPIRATEHLRCSVCSSSGVLLYKGQTDRLFHASGTWDTFRCANPACDAVWLNPAPLVDDLPIAYEDYYTHQSESLKSRTTPAKAAYRLLRLGYLSLKYGYREQVDTGQRLLGALLYLLPLLRAGVDEEVRQLRAHPGGLLLDVGCGSGDWLLQMRDLGWVVEGVDFDNKAVQAARERGLMISSGSLESQNYPTASFDAVTLNHVVEHLPDALVTLSECHRILKPGGILVLYTPNSVSLGHAVFRSYWRGLEPPRHLQIFGPLSLGALLRQAGFKDPSITTANSPFYWRQSLALFLRSERQAVLDRDSKSVWVRGVSLALATMAQLIRTFDDGRGESLVAHATRK